MNIQTVADALKWWGVGDQMRALRSMHGGPLGPDRLPDEPFLEFLVRSYEWSKTQTNSIQ